MDQVGPQWVLFLLSIPSPLSLLSLPSHQPELTDEDGPIGLICAPTRELCQQIYHEARKFGKVYGLRSCVVYGGVSKWEQVKALKDGAEILVATPVCLLCMPGSIICSAHCWSLVTVKCSSMPLRTGWTTTRNMRRTRRDCTSSSQQTRACGLEDISQSISIFTLRTSSIHLSISP